MISIQNVKKRFGDLQVLDGLSLTVNRGETVVILGRSGMGKSVLLKHIIGITKPDSGKIEVDGACISDLTGPKLYKAILHMGMLFQNAALFDSLTVEENVGFFLLEHGDIEEKKPLSFQEIQIRVQQALEMVGLSGTEKKLPSQLSGGMRKRIALARLIVYRPYIILYDEPTTGLDPLTSMQINELIVKTQLELKATSVVVTHDISSALYIGDRLALMENGKISHIEKPDVFMQIDNPIIQFLRETTAAPKIKREIT